MRGGWWRALSSARPPAGANRRRTRQRELETCLTRCCAEPRSVQTAARVEATIKPDQLEVRLRHIAALAFFTKASTMPGSFFPLSSLCSAAPTVRIREERNWMRKCCTGDWGPDGSEWKGGKDLDAARDVDCEWKHRRHALRNRRRLQPYTHPKPSGLLSQLAHIFRGDTQRKNPRERRTPGDEQREAALLDRLGDRPIEGLTRAARRRPSHLRVLNPKRPMDSASRRLHKNSEEEDGKIPAAPRRRGRALPWLDVS